MNRKILVISETVFFNLYKDGLKKYAEDNRDIVDLYYLDYPKEKLDLVDKLQYKYDINEFRNNYYNRIREKVIECIKNYDTILFINLFYDKEYFIQEELAELLKQKDTRILFVDSIKTIDQNIKFFDCFNQIWSFEKQDVIYGKEKFGVDIQYIPIGTAYNMYLQDREYTKDIDVCFVGIATKKRLEYLDVIAEYCDRKKLNFFVSGHFWHNNNWLNYHIGQWKFTRKHPVLAKYVSNRFIVPKDLAQVYARSKIVLNINVEYHKSLNQRCFDVMVCDSLLLNDKQEIGDLPVRDGKDFVMCDDVTKMIEKIDFYMQHDVERKKIANNGKWQAEKNFLFKQTLEKLLEE